MFDILSQILFAIIRTIFQATLNIFLYSLLSRIFIRWLGLNTMMSLLCSNYCISKILFFIEHLRLSIRLKKKKPEERILLDQLSWSSSSTREFETDWENLLNDDKKHILTSIVNVPFHKGWLFFVMILFTDYQMNNFDSNYLTSVFRTIALIMLLIAGAAVRYQSLFERERKKCLDFMRENPNEFERYIVYSQNTIPIASVCLQRKDTDENAVFLVQLCQLNSKFRDYFYNIADFTCRNLIQRMKTYAEENHKSIRLIWSLPTCQKNWTYAIQANKFLLNNTYRDFSFMPFVHSYIEQYEYQELEIEMKKDQ